jgi:hypothetical protein
VRATFRGGGCRVADDAEDVMSTGAEEKELVNNGAELAKGEPDGVVREETDPLRDPLVSGGRAGGLGARLEIVARDVGIGRSDKSAKGDAEEGLGRGGTIGNSRRTSGLISAGIGDTEREFRDIGTGGGGGLLMLGRETRELAGRGRTTGGEGGVILVIIREGVLSDLWRAFGNAGAVATSVKYDERPAPSCFVVSSPKSMFNALLSSMLSTEGLGSSIESKILILSPVSSLLSSVPTTLDRLSSCRSVIPDPFDLLALALIPWF